MDASQEVFLRAYRFLRRYDSRRPFEPWLMRMTVNVRRDLWQKEDPQLRRNGRSGDSALEKRPTHIVGKATYGDKAFILVMSAQFPS